MGKLLSIILFAVLIVVLVAAGPLLVIWSWNTLFGTVHLIDYTFWTWFAVLILGVFLSPNVKVNKK
jgi:hypothetical protein